MDGPGVDCNTYKIVPNVVISLELKTILHS